MGNTGFQFDPRQQYQLDAIAAVVDLFDGQPRDADTLAVIMHGTVRQAADGQLAVNTAQEIGAIGNNLVLDEAAILANLQAVQDRNVAGRHTLHRAVRPGPLDAGPTEPLLEGY